MQTSSLQKTEPEVKPASAYRRVLDLCAEKTRRNLPDLAAGARTWSFAPDGDYSGWAEGFEEIGNWTTGFFAGMGVLAWKHTGDPGFLDAVRLADPLYQKKVGEGAADTMHDLGFLYSPYAVALARETDDPAAAKLALRAAEVLADRFIPEGGYIRAWGRMDERGTEYDGLAIIDCMMNLPLLYRASEATGDSRFHDIAVRHSDTTLRHFLREDGSVYHSFRFRPDGSPAGPDNFCGRAVESHWARGAAWAMYGFALGHRHTGDARYLDAALAVTRKWISLLDDEVVPVWDFRLGEGERKLRDSSAAAIAVCAIQELSAQGHADAGLVDAKDSLLERLCSEDYIEDDSSVRGVLRAGQVGDGVGRARAAFTSWGDYFLMESVARELGVEATWW